MATIPFTVPWDNLSDPLSLGLGCCGLIIAAIIVIILLMLLFKIIIEFLPATVLAVAVYFLSGGNWVYALLAFGIVALIMYVARHRKGPEHDRTH